MANHAPLDHPLDLRLFGYPLVVGMLETTMVITLCMAATALRRHVGEGWGLLSLFLLFPMVFYGVNFGIGAPVLVAINMPVVDPGLVLAATLFSISAGLALMLGLARLLPLGAAAKAEVVSTARLVAETRRASA